MGGRDRGCGLLGYGMADRKPRKRGRPKEAPTCNCALLCEDVLVSQARGKHMLHGVINVIFVPQLPSVVGPFVTYVRISNVYPNQTIHVSFERAEDGEKVFEFAAEPPERPDQLGVYTFVVTTPPFRLEQDGRYIFSVRSDGTPLAESPISVVCLPISGG